MKIKSDPRHTSRKVALSSIFCWLFSDPDLEDTVVMSKDTLNVPQEDIDKELAKYIFDGVRSHSKEIDRLIQECAPEWPIDKIAKIDLVILRIAVFELVFGKKAPVKVVIDEAVELSKEFGNDTSHKFVNGVLGTIVDNYIEEK